MSRRRAVVQDRPRAASISTSYRRFGLLHAKGFILTGGDCNETRNPLETSRRGIFAIGDVRSGSIKRVAAAVGEGAQVVATLHATLASMESNIPGEPAAQRD